MDVLGLGTYIREQRRKSRLTLQKLSGAAGVSIPYLSQVERGLRRPSAEMLQAIAKGLRISAQTLYVQAGILDEKPEPDVHTAVMGDPGLTERQKQALLSVYDSFRQETERRRAKRKTLAPGDGPPAERSPNGAAEVPTSVRRSPSRARRNRVSGRAETQADVKPSPGSPSSSRSLSTDRTQTKGGAR